ncbi:MAG: hypothetical protein JNN05_03210 [Candidatus Omnitrophica bacterium]|nr:hypothetical protein [Candidatus Omnitrophota bacterium]
MDVKLWIIVIGIMLLFGALVWAFSPASDSKVFTVDGVLVDSSMYQDFPIKGKGQKTNVNLQFDVGQSKPITMSRKTGEPEPKPGMKAKISYQLGRVFQNKVYLDYQWMN